MYDCNCFISCVESYYGSCEQVAGCRSSRPGGMHIKYAARRVADRNTCNTRASPAGARESERARRERPEERTAMSLSINVLSAATRSRPTPMLQLIGSDRLLNWLLGCTCVCN
ncbi:unnamed protein product [Colias eurytheme]|nr:unnamed protein product [Colias eurytheme]